MFLKISQNSQENTCAKVFFKIKLQAEAYNFVKKEALALVFPVIFAKYLKTSFLQNISGGCFCIKHMSWSFFAKISITDLHRDSNTSLDLADSSSIMEYLLSLDFLIHFTSVPLSFVRVSSIHRRCISTFMRRKS